MGKGGELKLQGAAPDRRLTGCVSGVTGGRPPALVDAARFEGREATLIAVRDDASGGWEVWAVGPDCTEQNPHILKQEHTGS